MKIQPLSEQLNPSQDTADLMSGQPLPDDLVQELMADDMLPEYDFDYSKALPNRFAAQLAQTRTVELDPDVAAIFTNQEMVNTVLRALIHTMPHTSRAEI